MRLDFSCARLERAEVEVITEKVTQVCEREKKLTVFHHECEQAVPRAAFDCRELLETRQKG